MDVSGRHDAAAHLSRRLRLGQGSPRAGRESAHEFPTQIHRRTGRTHAARRRAERLRRVGASARGRELRTHRERRVEIFRDADAGPHEQLADRVRLDRLRRARVLAHRRILPEHDPPYARDHGAKRDAPLHARQFGARGRIARIHCAHRHRQPGGPGECALADPGHRDREPAHRRLETAARRSAQGHGRPRARDAARCDSGAGRDAHFFRRRGGGAHGRAADHLHRDAAERALRLQHGHLHAWRDLRSIRRRPSRRGADRAHAGELHAARRDVGTRGERRMV